MRQSLGAWALGLLRLDFTGVAFAALFFCLSLTPSLMPRDWFMAGLIGGINAAIGYGLGVLFAGLVRRLFLRGRSWWPLPVRLRYGVQTAVIAGSVGASVVMTRPASSWQRQIGAVMNIDVPVGADYLRTVPVAIVVGGALIAGSRIIKDAIKFLARLMIRRWHIDDEIAMFIGTAIVVMVTVMLVNGVLYRGFVAGANTMFQPQNAATRSGV